MTTNIKAPFVLLIIAIVFFAGVAIPSPAEARTGMTFSKQEADAFRAINNARAAHGLPRLRVDARLTRASRWMSRDMAVNKRFSHTDSLGRNPFQRMERARYPSNTWRGENLAAGNVEGVPTFRQWLNSPGHRRNMANRNYRVMGIARVCMRDSVYHCYWTTKFGSQMSEPVRARIRR